MLKVDEGDWVRFYQGGKLVIGIVQYIRPSATGFHGPEVCTEIGTCQLDSVIECRSGRGIQTAIGVSRDPRS